MTTERFNEIVEEVRRMRSAGSDPAQMCRERLFEILEEVLGVEIKPYGETHEQWRQRQREEAGRNYGRKVRHG